VEEGGAFLLGQLVLARGGRGRAEAGRLYGLNVLRAEADPEGFWGPRRLRRAGRALCRGGALRTLAPSGLLPLLEGFGLRPVEIGPFLRSQAPALALAALERRGLSPGRCAVALRGVRADRDMARAAEELCPLVRGLIIDAPRGGPELARQLRREYGVAILPPGERGQVELAFQEGYSPVGEDALELFGPRPRLGGLVLSAPGLEGPDQEDLPLLAALWEGGKLGAGDIKIT